MKSPLHYLRWLSFSTLLFAACGPSLASMHERATVGEVQADAPLHARRSVLIQATPERVYSLLSNVAEWPSWQPNISQVTAPAQLAPGATFSWTNGNSKISSRLAAVHPGAMLAWTGSVSLAKAIHVWRLSPEGGGTRVDVEETMDGFLLTWFYGQKELEADMARSLANLTSAAEKHAEVPRVTDTTARSR